MAMTMSTILRLTVTAAFLISAAVSQAPPTKYTNHTVGDAAGWFYNSTTNTSATNYSSWASTQTFSLGDFLIFNTNSNQTVIQTFDNATFLSCSSDDAMNNETFEYDGGNLEFGEALTISLPLGREGPNYFFSDADDGIQCRSGLAFEIHVSHGLGLPPSLNHPPPPPYMEPLGPALALSPPDRVPSGSQARLNGGVSVHTTIASWIILAFFGVSIF